MMPASRQRSSTSRVPAASAVSASQIVPFWPHGSVEAFIAAWQVRGQIGLGRRGNQEGGSPAPGVRRSRTCQPGVDSVEFLGGDARPGAGRSLG
jgi:hypothetical protein